MPPRVFLSKSAEAIENKGRASGKTLQESLRVRKLKEVRGIEEVKEVEDGIAARFVRDSGGRIVVARWVRGRWARRGDSLSLGFRVSIRVASMWARGMSRSGAHFVE